MALRARMTTVAVSFDCPKCQEPLPNPENGSLMWDVTEIRPEAPHTCYRCGASLTVRVPR